MKRSLIAIALGTAVIVGCSPSSQPSAMRVREINNAAIDSAMSAGRGWSGNANSVMLTYSTAPQDKATKPTRKPTRKPTVERKHPSTMWVDTAGTAGLNLRKAPGTDNAIILSIPHGASVHVINRWHKDDYGNHWYKVRYQSYTGYVYAPLLASHR